MWFKKFLRKVVLCIAIGGHSVFRTGMDKEKIEAILHTMNQTRVEVSINEDDEGSGIIVESCKDNPLRLKRVSTGETHKVPIPRKNPCGR